MSRRRDTWTPCPRCRQGYMAPAHQACPHCGAAPLAAFTVEELATLRRVMAQHGLPTVAALCRRLEDSR